MRRLVALVLIAASVVAAVFLADHPGRISEGPHRVDDDEAESMRIWPHRGQRRHERR